MLSPYKLEPEKHNGKRLYRTPTGNLYPSVSTILSHSNFSVLNWRKKVGKEEANRVSREACKRGSRLHSMIDSYFTSGQMPAKGFDWFDKVSYVLPHITCILSESSIWHDDQGYAGTFDLLCNYRGKTSVIDWKTSKVPKDKEMCEKHFMQIAAYAKGIESVYGIKVERGVVIVINEVDRDIQEFSLIPDSIEKYFGLFCEKNRLFKEYYANNPTQSQSDTIANIPTWGLASFTNFSHCAGG